MRALLSVVLVACAPREAAGVGDPDARVTTEAELEAALSRSGFLLQPRGFSTDPLVSATANEYVVGGTGQGFLQVYTFGSAEAAERDARRVANQGVGGSLRVYRSGPLVVAHYGADPALGASLTSLTQPPTSPQSPVSTRYYVSDRVRAVAGGPPAYAPDHHRHENWYSAFVVLPAQPVECE